MDLLKILKPKPKSIDWKLEDGHRVDKAFVSGGVQYYYIKDTFDTFAGRAMDALQIYEKWNMRCSREYLVDMNKAIKAILSDPKKIDLTELFKISSNLDERLSFALPTEDIIWEFASVAFFDETESPYRHNPEYGKEKIKKWKSNGDVSDFFFLTPIKTLIPCPDFSKEDLVTYLKTIQKITDKHTAHLRSLLLSRGLKADSSLASN